MALQANNELPKVKKETDILDTLTFFGEEIVFREEKIQKQNGIETAFTNSGMPHEKDQLGRYKVLKVGLLQTKVKEGDYILVNQNGLPKEITIEGIGVIKDTYSLPTHQRIYCKIDV